MIHQPTNRFRRSRWRIGGGLAAAVLVLAALSVADRAGWFGSHSDDYARYHNHTYTVVRVSDGDTIAIDAPDGRRGQTTLRLWGVDTPETNDPRRLGQVDHFGPQATAFTRQAALHQPVRLVLVQNHTRDKYQRLLVYVYLPDGTMLNERLLEGGFAYADLRFNHPCFQRFKKLESRAEKSRTGLWKDVRPDQWPSWRQRELNVAPAQEPAREPAS